MAEVAAARELTDRIRQGLEEVWRLLHEAHRTKAHHALGYKRWGDYIRSEFGMSRQNAYRKVAYAKDMEAIALAAGVAPAGYIPERQARRLRPVLAEVCAVIEARVAAGEDPVVVVDEVLASYDGVGRVEAWELARAAGHGPGYTYVERPLDDKPYVVDVPADEGVLVPVGAQPGEQVATPTEDVETVRRGVTALMAMGKAPPVPPKRLAAEVAEQPGLAHVLRGAAKAASTWLEHFKWALRQAEAEDARRDTAEPNDE